MGKIAVAIVSLSLLFASNPAFALSFGDFTGATLTTGVGGVLSPDNSASWDQWIGVGNSTSGWQIVEDTGNFYARNWGGGNYVLMQGVSASGISSSDMLDFYMDYAYTQGTISGAIGRVSVLGGNSGDLPIGVYAGGSANWDFNTWDTLFTQALEYTSAPSGWDSVSGSFSVGGSYDVLAVVVRAGIHPESGETSGLRAVDNVSLGVAPVPEPGTMLLLGSGLIGLAGYGRKRKK